MERSNFIDIQKQVQILDNLFQEHINNVKEANTVYTQLATTTKTLFPSTIINSAKTINTVLTNTNNTIVKQNNTLKTNVQAILNQAKSYQGLAKQKEHALRQAERERQQVEKLNNAYNRIEALMKRASAEYNNLAARKNFGIQLTQKEEARYTQLQARIERFNGVLKKTDADIGKFNRNVGNYGTQWDGLRFQTNQLVRELPAMAYGVNVFFGAISNNLPMFIDEVNKVREAQRLAIAEGKTAPSVISRITGALFNWQTALVLGITYLTLHGKEVLEWTKGLFGARTELDLLAKAQVRFNSVYSESATNYEKQRQMLQSYINIAKDSSKSEEDRIIAAEKLISLFPQIYGNMTAYEVITGKVTEKEQKFAKALYDRAKAESLISESSTLYKQMAEIDGELKRRMALAEDRSKRISEINRTKNAPAGSLGSKIYASATEELATIRKIDEAIKKSYKDNEELNYLLADESELKKQLNILNDEYLSKQQAINSLIASSIIIDKKDTNTKKEKTKANYDYVDVLVTEYELMKLLYEIEIERNKKIFEDEKATYSERGKAMKEMYDNQLALIELTKNEEIRLAEISSNELREKAKKARKDNVITEKEYISELINIAQVHSKKLMIIDEQYKTQKKEINNEIAKSYDVIIKKLWEYNSLINGISKGQLEDRGKELEFLSGLKFGEATKGLEQFNKNIQELASAEKIGKLSLELAKAEEELSKLDPKSDEYQKWLSEVIRLQRELQEETINTTKKTKEELAKLEQDYKKFVQGFQNEVINVLPSLQTLLSDDFQNMISSLFEEGLDRQAIMAVATQVTEVFQDMYNLMQKSSDAYYERQFETLEMQKDVAIRFAGDSAVAREEIERQYEQKRKQIERERAKQQKETAIFNATIDLAQGIMATIGQLGFPDAIPMIALLSALGAVQIGMIASQPLPAYAEGTLNHIGGSMLVNDGKGSNYRETIVTPDGKIIRPSGRNVVMDAPKGTQVFTHDQWQQRIGSILNGDKNRYSSPVNKGITKEDLKELLSAQFNNQNERFEVNIDKQGINTTIVRGSMRVKKLNNRIRIKSNN